MLIKIIPINKIDLIIKKHRNIGLHKLHNLLLLDNNTVLIKNLLLIGMLFLIHNQLYLLQMLEKFKKLKDLKYFQLKLKLLNKDNLITIRKMILHLPINRLLDLLENLQDLNPIIYFLKMIELLRLILDHKTTLSQVIIIIIIQLIIIKDMHQIKI